MKTAVACVLVPNETALLTCGCNGRIVTEIEERVSDLTLKAHLEDIRETVRYKDLLGKMEFAAVKGARESGATWEQLGEALGVTHQAARQRWDRKLKALVETTTQ